LFKQIAVREPPFSFASAAITSAPRNATAIITTVNSTRVKPCSESAGARLVLRFVFMTGKFPCRPAHNNGSRRESNPQSNPLFKGAAGK